MNKLHYSIIINAPKEKVWSTMLDDATYRQWTAAFHPGSHFVGDWSEGSTMKFIGPEAEGKISGMVSRVKENRPYEFLSIEHFGVIENGVEITTGDKVKDWAGVHENYTFTQTDGATKVDVAMEATDEFSKMLDEMWPKALRTLKEIAEKK